MIHDEPGRAPERLGPGRHRSGSGASSHDDDIDLPFGCDSDQQTPWLPGIGMDHYGPCEPAGSVLAVFQDPVRPGALGRTDPFQPVNRQRSPWKTPANQLHLAAGTGVMDMGQ